MFKPDAKGERGLPERGPRKCHTPGKDCVGKLTVQAIIEGHETYACENPEHRDALIRFKKTMDHAIGVAATKRKKNVR